MSRPTKRRPWHGYLLIALVGLGCGNSSDSGDQGPGAGLTWASCAPPGKAVQLFPLTSFSILPYGETTFIGSQFLYSRPACSSQALGLAMGGFVSQMQIQGDRIYWADNFAAAIFSVPFVGGSQAQRVEEAKVLGAGALVKDDTEFYWGSEAGFIQRRPLAGGPIITVIDGRSKVTSLLVDETDIYWLDLYQGPEDDGGLWRMPKHGSTPTRLAGALSADSIAQDASNIYWVHSASPTPGHIQRIPKNGDPPTDIYSGLVPGGNGVALDETYLYLIDNYHGELSRLPLAGGELVVLATGLKLPNSIAVDATSIYWTGDDGAYRMDK